MTYHVRNEVGWLIGEVSNYNASKIMNTLNGVFIDWRDKDGTVYRVFEIEEGKSFGSNGVQIYLFPGTILIPIKD